MYCILTFDLHQLVKDEPREQAQVVGRWYRLLDVAIWVAQKQVSEDLYYCIEHPAGASTWHRPNAAALNFQTPGIWF